MRTYGKLREKIKKVFGTMGAFAKAMGLDRSTISKKMNSIVPWDQPEMEKCCKLLGYSNDAIPELFFYDE